MNFFGIYLVTTETFVDQRSRSTPPSMIYATLENALDQQEMQANLKRCAVSSFNRSFLCTRTTLLNIGRVIEPHANTFSISRLATGLTGIKGNPFFIAHPCQQFLCRKPRYFPSIFSFSSVSSLWPLFFLPPFVLIFALSVGVLMCLVEQTASFGRVKSGLSMVSE